MASTLRRLHPATVLIELLRRLGSVAYLIVIALVLRLFGSGQRTEFYEYAIAGLAAFSTVGALLRYLTLRYGLEAGHLVIRSGLIMRQHRSIPLDRIQNIAMKRGLLHRALGVTDVDIETAGGATPEARLSALSLAAAETLKAELLQRPLASTATGGPSPAVIAPAGSSVATGPDEPLWVSPLNDLLLAGATENRIGVILAALGGFWYTFGEAIAASGRSVAPGVEQVLHQGTAVVVALIFLLVAGLAVLGWLTSITMTVVQYFGFELRRAGHRLRLRYGLLTQHETLVPMQRIQVMRLEAPWLRDRLGCLSVFVSTAGSALDHASAASVPLCPIVRRTQVGGLVRRVFERLDLDAVAWRLVSRRTVRRAFIRYTLVLTPLAIAAVWRFGWAGILVIPIIVLAAGTAAWLRYRAMGYCELDEFVLARSGVLTRRCWVVPRDKIQFVELNQTPFQHRLGLASLTVHTAGGAGGQASIVDVPADDARAMQDRLSRRAAAGGWARDGV